MPNQKYLSSKIFDFFCLVFFYSNVFSNRQYVARRSIALFSSRLVYIIIPHEVLSGYSLEVMLERIVIEMEGLTGLDCYAN